MRLSDWYKWGYAKTDISEKLFQECPDQIERVDSKNLSLHDFKNKYEKLNKPVVIRGITNSFNVDKYWTFEVSFTKAKG